MDKIKVLYVDDEPTNLVLFEIYLSEQYHVLTAPSGAAGLEILSRHPDVSAVISDMKMPGMNGIEFIKQLKVKDPDKKCFIFTGYEITSEIQNAIDNGLILNCMNKPMSMNSIASIITKALES